MVEPIERSRIEGNRWDLLVPAKDATWTPHRSVSICIPARDPEDRITRLLAALSVQTYPHDLIQVVIADDSSSQPIVVDADAHPFDVAVVRQDAEGFAAGRARHLAACAAAGEVFVFIDVDMVPARQVIDMYLRWFERNDAVVPFGFTTFVDWGELTVDQMADALRSDDHDRLDGGGQVDSQQWRERSFRTTGDLRRQTPGMFRNVVGATLAVSARQYHECGGFRDLGVRGVEDIEFGYRLQNNGALLIPDRDARHWHSGERTMSGARIAEIRRQRDPFTQALLPVGGFRSSSPGADASVEVVPQLLVHVSGVAGARIAERSVEDIRNAGGSEVDARVGGLDTAFRAAYAQAAVAPGLGWADGAPQAIVAEMIRQDVGTLFVVSDDGSVVAEVITTRALRAVRSLDGAGRHQMRRLFGIGVVRTRRVLLQTSGAETSASVISPADAGGRTALLRRLAHRVRRAVDTARMTLFGER